MNITEKIFAQLTIESLKSVKASIYWIDTHGKFIYVNEYACKKHDFSQEELLTKHVWDIDPIVEPSDWESIKADAKKSPLEFEAIHINRHKQQYPVHISSTYHKIEDFEVYICHVHDLSEVKKTEEQLYLIDKIFSSSKELMSYVDKNYTYKIVNQAYCDLFKKSKDAIVGKTISDLLGYQVFNEHIKPYFDKTLNGEATSFENTIEIDNKTMYFHVKLSPFIRQATDIIEGVVINIADITHLKAQDRLLLEQSKMVAISELISNLAHQWRQPLSMISSIATGTLLQHNLNQLEPLEFEKNMRLINKKVQYLSKTIDNLDQIMETKDDTQTFTLSSTFDTFIVIINETIEENKITIIKDLDKEITLTNNPNYLIQSFINIINNSIDAFNKKELDKRYVFITTKIIDNQIFISFKDNGGGICNELRDKLFEPYTTTKHQSLNTGLGLSATYNFISKGLKGIIEAQNISYTYNNKLYKGAEIIIMIPF